MFDLEMFLAMNYSDQWNEIRKYTDWRPSEESIGDLAFRLRDEAVESGYRWNKRLTGCSYQYALKKVYEITKNRKSTTMGSWLREEIQSVDMIAAALEAMNKKL